MLGDVGEAGAERDGILDGSRLPLTDCVSLPLPDGAPPAHTPFQAATELGSDMVPVMDVSVVHE